MPRVSVIVPTYNRRELVVEAIESVRAQTFPDFELLVVDDASTDGTAEMVEERYADEPRLQLIRRSENGGIAAARNSGLERATGELVAFLDSDDLYLPRHLETQVAALDARPDVHLVICDARCEGGALNNVPTAFSEPHRQPATSLEAMFRGAWGLPSCMMVRREPIERLRFDPAFATGEDTDFLFRFFRAGYAGFENPEVLSVYRSHDPERQATKDERTELSSIRVLEHHLDGSPFPARTRYEIDRRTARLLARQGRWRDARPHCWGWLKYRPGSREAWRHFLRSLWG